MGTEFFTYHGAVGIEDGRAINAPFIIDGLAFDNMNPTVGVMNNSFVVFWETEYSAIDHDIYGTRVTWDGNSKEFKVGPHYSVETSGNDERNPAIGDPIEPYFFGYEYHPRRWTVVFQSRKSGTSGIDLIAQDVCENGELKCGLRNTIFNSGGETFNTNPAVNGGLVVFEHAAISKPTEIWGAWVDSRVWATRISESSSFSMTNPVVSYSTGYFPGQPDRYLVAWKRGSSPSQIYSKIVWGDGTFGSQPEVEVSELLMPKAFQHCIVIGDEIARRTSASIRRPPAIYSGNRIIPPRARTYTEGSSTTELLLPKIVAPRAAVFGFEHTGKPMILPPREILEREIGYNWITVATK